MVFYRFSFCRASLVIIESNSLDYTLIEVIFTPLPREGDLFETHRVSQFPLITPPNSSLNIQKASRAPFHQSVAFYKEMHNRLKVRNLDTEGPRSKWRPFSRLRTWNTPDQIRGPPNTH